MMPALENCNRKSSLHPVREKVQAAFSGCLKWETQPLTRRQYSFADERIQLKPCVFQFRHNASVLMIRVVF